VYKLLKYALKIAGVSYPTAQKVLRLAEIEGLL
jgi:hypothetical protein